MVRKNATEEQLLNASASEPDKDSKGNSSSGFRLLNNGYERLRSDDFSPEQFEKPKHRQTIPYSSIGMAVALFVAGSILITLAVLINLSILPKSLDESMYGLYLLGSLLFIPGSYYSYIAYQAYYETPGYTYDDIPIME